MKTYTNWTSATTNLTEAIESLMACVKYYGYGHIEIRKNGNQDYPIMINNDEFVKDFRSYKSSYGSLARNYDFTVGTEMERHMRENYVQLFLTQANQERYFAGLKLEGAFTNIGRATPVLMEDANEWRGGDYDYRKDRQFVDHWVLDGSTKKIDETIGLVYVVCHRGMYDKMPAPRPEWEMVFAEFMNTTDFL